MADKKFCPPNMIRIDDFAIEYPTAWGCELCLRLCFSETAATQHSLDCPDNISDSHETNRSDE